MDAFRPSLLDTDLYKFTMQQAVLETFPDAVARYRFYNRGKPFDAEVAEIIVDEIKCWQSIRASDDEIAFLRGLPFFKHGYIGYLRGYGFDTSQVTVKYDGDLSISIEGPWVETILWEVHVLALVSEVASSFEPRSGWSSEIAFRKGTRLREGACNFADFGTRRRRSLAHHRAVLAGLKKSRWPNAPGLIGTSNVMLAKEFGLAPIGTMAHEWIMGVSGIAGVRRANFKALEYWQKVYRGSLGIALTDTFGTNAFFEDFDGFFARLFDGVRHDSGCPFRFAEKTIAHYESLGIDPRQKSIVFSDGLDVDRAIDIQNQFGDSIKCSYGIGTHFTNDFQDRTNIVMKLDSIDGQPVVKLGDDPGKETGNRDAVRAAKWALDGTPLDKA